MVFHLLFEQSGTFKNVLKKLGYQAYDYDILNDFNETDYQIDIFKEIDSAYKRERETIFDKFEQEDQLIAFFPCVRFEDQIQLFFRGTSYSQTNWSDERKLEYDLKLHDELNVNYKLITELAIICIQKNLKLIIENPLGTYHYLTKYWCLKPSLIDYDRRERGDSFKKPTQYWFINCEPKNNLVLEHIVVRKTEKVKHCHGAKRSMLTPEYAERFLKEFVLEEE